MRTHRLPEVVEAAVEDLVARAEPRLREALLERYSKLTQNPKADGGAGVRTVLLTGLRAVAEHQDLEVFERAALVVELRPPGPVDTAQNLRAAALLGIAHLDLQRAAVYAARLLSDPNDSQVTAQPGLTAVHVLAVADRTDTLYLHAQRPGGAPAVRAEAIRALTHLPAGLAAELVEAVLKGEDETAMLGAVDLALGHSGAEVLKPLRRFMRETDRLDVYGYVAAAAGASRREEALELLHDELGAGPDPVKKELLEAALRLT